VTKKDHAGFSRRDVLGMAAAVPLALKAAVPLFQTVTQPRTRIAPFDRRALEASTFAIDADNPAGKDVELIRGWNGSICRSRLVSRAREMVKIRRVTMFTLPLGLPGATALYGEGFQMLSQTGGTLSSPADYSQYTDEKHYRIPAEGRAFYGMMTLTPPGHDAFVLAFTSCARFAGSFELDGSSLRVVQDLEGMEIRPGETLPLEEFMFASGPDRSKLLADVASRLAEHHPVPGLSSSRDAATRRATRPPTGWCSWYCFGAQVTDKQVLDNLDVIARTIPALKYVQIDDGYQPAMGDWLETGAAFGGNVRNVLAEIRTRGFEPAIWVAPFIA
jgi:alpha-galactosidase